MIQVETYEANIVRHCNNRCAACSHASPWAEHYVMSPESLESDLKHLSRVSHAKQFWLLGGEPLLHPDLVALLDISRKSGVSDEVNILTNATLLDRAPEAMWSKINYLRISAYKSLDPAQLVIAKERAKRHKFGLGIDYIDKFFKQFASHPTGDSFFRCPWRDRCWTVHEGYLFLCPNAAFFPNQFMGLLDGIDGLPLNEALTEDQLSAYLKNRKHPFRACEICEPYSAQCEWHQCKTREEWVKDSMVKGEVIECLQNWAQEKHDQD